MIWLALFKAHIPVGESGLPTFSRNMASLRVFQPNNTHNDILKQSYDKHKARSGSCYSLTFTTLLMHIIFKLKGATI